MLKKLVMIMWHDRRTGPLRIVRKSYARYRRFGYRDIRRKLEREYFALYPGSTQHRDRKRRYRQWRKRQEKDLLSRPVPAAKHLFTVVLIPEERPSLRYLRTAVQSVRRQTYGHWRLCCCLPGESHEGVHTFLEKIAQNDIRIILGEKDDLIRMIEESGGEYVLPLHASDRLAPHALAVLAEALEERSFALAYSDDDRIDNNGERHDPYFKCDWNPDLFFSHNYIGRFWCMSSELFLRVRAHVGSWDHYRLLLEAVRELEPEEIRHLPQILCHCRVDRQTSAVPSGSETIESALHALRTFFADRSELEIEEGLIPGSCRIRYPIPDPKPLVSIIIPTRDQYGLLHQCIESILEKTHYTRYEILIVDNQSKDPKTLEYLKRLEREYHNIRVLPYDKPFNYSAINNFAAERAEGEVLVLMNNDVEVISEGWLTEMVRHALRPEIGAVGAKLYYDNLTVQHAGVVLGLGEVAGHAHKYFPRESDGYFGRLKLVQNYSAVTGACLAVRKALYREVGGLNAEHLTVAFNDVDFCLKLVEKGYRNLWTPYAELYHHESRSRGIDNTPEKQARFEREVYYMVRRWRDLIESDPCYSPHLSSFFEDFRIETYWGERRKLRRKGQRDARNDENPQKPELRE